MTTRAGRRLLEGTFPSTMSDEPLSIRYILEHAMRNFPRKGIVTRDGPEIVRFTYEQLGRRVAQLAHALRDLGIGPGDRVASFAWNGHRHWELYYAVPMIGAVLHTVNIRLFPDQVDFILEHAGDEVVFYDASLVRAVAAFHALRPDRGRTFVRMGDEIEPFPGAQDYEALLAGKPETYDWPEIDERAGALMCYTSATTGDPKGVVFSHRSTFIHALGTGFGEMNNIVESDRCMPIVPMFHVNAWGFPFLCPLAGADLVMPMERLDAPGVVELCEAAQVSFCAGVPTVWLAVRDLLVAQKKTLPHLGRVVIGGAAMPPSLRDDLADLGIDAIHGWGMTEMSPVGTVNAPSSEFAGDPALQRRERYKQGRFAPIVRWKIVDEHGAEVPADGVSRGELCVRGFAVAREYFENEAATAAAFDADGWFHTGDVATVDRYGYLEIVDRVKDFIKSGGEWISSVEVENTLMGHPAVKEACVFGVPHPKWQERPVATVVLRSEATAGEDELRAWLGERLAKWQTPDRIFVLDAIPRTGVGKFLKRDLRERYAALFNA